MSNFKADVSVITLHHTGELIYKFITSIKKSRGVIYEIIIVTSDDNLNIAGCKMIYSKEMPARKRNIGVLHASADIIAFFDDDTEIDENCLKRYKQFLDYNPKVGMVYGKLYKADEPNRLDEAGGFLTSTGFIWSRAGQNIVDNGQYSVAEPILAGKSASCAIKTEVFNLAGGFDESFGILGEETDLSWRVWLQNYEVWFLPRCVGLHYFNTKHKPVKKYYSSERVFRNGPRNYIAMLYKNLGIVNLIKILPIHILLWVITALMLILTGKCNSGILIFKGIFDNIIGIRKLHRKRKRVQISRLTSDREIFINISKSPKISYYIKRFFRYRITGLHG